VSATGVRHVYGPVPSRRLGRSLGIDLVPFKTCTYDCLYCQLGRTTNKTVDRREYVSVDAVMEELKRELAAGVPPDAITLSGSGEPTLHDAIGNLVEKIKSMANIPLAVLTNGSLLWMDDVQDALMAADLVLPSLDAGDEYTFRYVNRPHENISLERVVSGIAAFTRRFPGEVWLEVFLLAGVTGITSEARKIAALAKHIGPARVQLNTVSRPPAEEFAHPLAADRMLDLKHLFPRRTELVGGASIRGVPIPAFRDARVEEILDLLGRRPCTVSDLATGLGIPATEALKFLNALIAAGAVTTVVLGERRFYILAGLKKRFEETA
jgi:wyosine [tRNA(Phe)-imidazoG37] synthetase (radical SAM superfamily)